MCVLGPDSKFEISWLVFFFTNGRSGSHEMRSNRSWPSILRYLNLLFWRFWLQFLKNWGGHMLNTPLVPPAGASLQKYSPFYHTHTVSAPQGLILAPWSHGRKPHIRYKSASKHSRFFHDCFHGVHGHFSPTWPVLHTCATWPKMGPRPNALDELQNIMGSLCPTKFLNSGTPPT